MSLLARRRAMMGAKKGFVHGTWEDLFRAIDEGTYATEYAVGEVLPLDLGSTYGNVGAEIVGFNLDTISDSTDKAPVTLVTKHLTKNKKRANPALNGTTEGTGAIGGWDKSELRSLLNNTVISLFPSIVQNRMLSVKKYSTSIDTTGTTVQNQLTNDKVWALSRREFSMAAGQTTESVGPQYSTFNTNAKRIKTAADSTAAGDWWARTAYSTERFYFVSTTGTMSTNGAEKTKALAFGFCVG